MPRDKRLYMTFPIDFDEHPKIEPLSDAAFRAFVSMNGYCRRQRLDGVIPGVAARKRWKAKTLAELVASHAERPLVVRDESNDTYILRSYADHQFTTADEQALHEVKAAAGAAGGRAKARAIAGAKQVPLQNVAESESRSESGLLTDVTDVNESSHLPDSGADGRDSKARIAAESIGINDIVRVTETFVRATQQPLTLGGSVMLAQAILSKSAGEVTKVDAYLASVCRKTPAEVQQAYFDLDIGAVA